MELSSSPSSSTGSLKRAKAHGNITQQEVVVCCIVDGCNSDLSQCGEYHRRHRACEAHSKTPKVTIWGLEKRFCQQCSKFHPLEEFDKGKRSCRERLDGHNRHRRRRRKPPQSDDSDPRCIFSTPQSMRLLSFGGPQVLANPAARPSSVKAENDSVIIFNSITNSPPLNYIDKQNSSYPTNSAPQSYEEFNQFQFTQDTDHHILPEAAYLVNNTVYYSGGINQAGNSNSSLSLLSSAPTSQPWDMGSSHMVHQQAQSSLVHHFGDVGQLFPYSLEKQNPGVVSDGEPSGTRSNNNNNNNNTSISHFHGMFDDGSFY